MEMARDKNEGAVLFGIHHVRRRLSCRFRFGKRYALCRRRGERSHDLLLTRNLVRKQRDLIILRSKLLSKIVRIVSHVRRKEKSRGCRNPSQIAEPIAGTRRLRLSNCYYLGACDWRCWIVFGLHALQKAVTRSGWWNLLRHSKGNQGQT